MDAVSLSFPLHGIDVSTPASEQRDQTTAVGVNVRALDPLADRARGGSRWGLSPLFVVPTRPGGVQTPTQHLNTVTHYDAAFLLTRREQDGETNAPGGLVADTMTSNFPDGPGPTGPGGGPSAPTAPPYTAGFNRRTPASPPAPYERVRPQFGSGVQPNRSTGPTTQPPPPPPPPTTLTRTYTPFAILHAPEVVGVFAIGPIAVPLTPPTDLTGDTVAVDYFGAAWNITTPLSAWAGTTLPTVAEINALFVAEGWADGGHPDGPYESSVDS